MIIFQSFLIFLILVSSSAYARRLNYIEAHNLRLSSQAHPAHWINPFVFNKKPGNLETNFFVSGQKNVLDLYEDMQSKNEAKIIKRLNQSYGKPYDLSAKINFGYKIKSFAQYFSTNGGAVLVVTDPVFPELKGFLFHDYTSSTSYLMQPLKGMVIKPQFNIGVRRILDRTLTTGDLVSEPIDVNFNKAPYVGFAELNLVVTQNTFGYGHFLFEINSFPLKSSEYEYWDTFLGYKTPNFGKKIPGNLTELSLYGGYSPLYAGKYDVDRTYKLGLRVAPTENLSFDIFTLDDFYPGALVSYNFTYLELSLLTFERAYDDFGNQKSRQYGLNLKLAW